MVTIAWVEGRSNAKWNVSLQFLPSDLLISQREVTFSPLKKGPKGPSLTEEPGDREFCSTSTTSISQALRSCSGLWIILTPNRRAMTTWGVEVQTWNGPGWCFLVPRDISNKWPFWDGEKVTRTPRLSDIQRLGIKRSCWITWVVTYLEDGLPVGCKWLGSPPFISHEVRPFGRGPTTRSWKGTKTSHGYSAPTNWDDPPSTW